MATLNVIKTLSFVTLNLTSSLCYVLWLGLYIFWRKEKYDLIAGGHDENLQMWSTTPIVTI